MGIDILENSRRHLRKIVNDYNGSLKKSGNVDVENAQSTKETKQKQLEAIDKEIDDLKDAISFYDNQKMETSLDKGTQRKTTENELPSLTQCTA